MAYRLCLCDYLQYFRFKSNVSSKMYKTQYFWVNRNKNWWTDFMITSEADDKKKIGKNVEWLSVYCRFTSQWERGQEKMEPCHGSADLKKVSVDESIYSQFGTAHVAPTRRSTEMHTMEDWVRDSTPCATVDEEGCDVEDHQLTSLYTSVSPSLFPTTSLSFSPSLSSSSCRSSAFPESLLAPELKYGECL